MTDLPCMDDDRQIFVPPSFIALFVPLGKVKPIASREEIETRYDYCEDLSQLLFDQMRDKMAEHGIPIDLAFSRITAVLTDSSLDLSEPESVWVLSRLTELSEPFSCL
jgi:hypothetical protein